MDANAEAHGDGVPGGAIACGLLAAAWVVVLAAYLGHRIVLSSDSMNNYVHVWAIARDIWHHGRVPWRLPILGHGDAYAYPYGFTNWTAAAIIWPAFGNWGVTLCSVAGAVGCIAATFYAFPELRHGWWAAAVLANPAIIEALLFGQQTFAWGATFLLLGIGVLAARPPARGGTARRRRAGDPRRDRAAHRRAAGGGVPAVRPRSPHAPALVRALRTRSRCRRSGRVRVSRLRRRDHARPARELRQHARARAC